MLTKKYDGVKNMKKRVLLFAEVFLFLTLPAFTEELMFVNIDSLTVREGPSADYIVVGQLKNNASVLILNSSGQWWKIKSGNIEGYANSLFLSNEKETPPISVISEKRSGYMYGGTTRDKSFQDDYDRAVREYDQRMMALPPGLVLPGGDTVQERVDRINSADIESDK